MGSTTASVTASSGYYAYATITWDSDSTVEVDVESNGSWRIRGRASAGDNTIYLSETGSVSGTFSATSGATYVLQVYDPVEGAYYNNTSTSLFTINSDSGGDDSGDDSGGSSGGDTGGNSGGGGSSSSNSSIYPTSGTQNGVTATFTISGSTVTVKVSSTSLYWRINGTNSGGDYGTYYINENRNSSGSFTAKDGHAYAFQVCSSSGYWSDGLIFYVNIGSGGGDSGGGGSSSGGSTNNGLKTYTVTALGVTAEVTYTSGPEVTITIKSWSGYSSIPYWRVKGRASQGDYNTYLSQTNASKASFDSYDGYNDGGKEYTFQVCKSGTWGNDSEENSVFLVDFSLSGDGSGGGTADSHTLYFNEGEGTNLTVTRTSSAYGVVGTMYSNGDIYFDDIWINDRFKIVVEAQEGYQLNELVVDGLQYTDGEYIFSGSEDASITTSATLVTGARIFNSSTSSWNTYTLYIYNGSSWNRYKPYIYDGSSWNMYS